MSHYALLNEGFYGAVCIRYNAGNGGFYEWDEESQQWVEVPEI